MSTVLCSTGALIGRPNGRDYRLLGPLSKKLHCDGFEFMMYGTWYDQVEELLEYLLNLKLCIPAMHCEKHIGEAISMGGAENFRKAFELFEINCHMANTLGAEKMVIHLWDGMTSDANFENNLNAYGELAAMAKDCDIRLLVENVVCNHENPMKHWCELSERYPDVKFIYDTKMAAFHDQLDMLYEPEYAWLVKEHHIEHFHVNDYAGGYMDWAHLKTLPIGAGQVDFDRFFQFIRRIKYDDTFTVEATAFRADGSVDTDMLNGCFKAVREYLLK